MRMQQRRKKERKVYVFARFVPSPFLPPPPAPLLSLVRRIPEKMKMK
jgi:hypothetical protein